jgi:outer membrane protein assembly factor BamB
MNRPSSTAHALHALALLTSAALASAGAGEGPAAPVHPAMMQETARVLELSLHGHPGGDARVVVFLRGGRPYHGWLTRATAANLPMPILTAPPGGHGLYDATTGEEIAYHPELFRRYGYKKPEWQQAYKDYVEKRIVARRDPDPPPLTLAGDTLAGTVDFPTKDTSRRLSITAKLSGSGFAGSWESRDYTLEDNRYGQKATPTTGSLTARFLDGHWDPQPGTEFAKGRNWPQTHGPDLNMSAIDCGRQLVDRITDARLVWVSEELVAGGKGNVNKVGFGVGPLTPNDIDGGDYCAPVVYDGKVYFFYIMTDLTAATNDPALAGQIDVIRGAPPGATALGHYVNRYLCLDARSGRTLWRKDTPVFLKDGFKGEKGGVAQTPAVVEGVLVHRNGGMLVGMDPTDGKELWTNPKCGDAGGYWSHENSVVGIAGVVIAGVNDGTCSGLAGFDPKSGAERWRLRRVRGFNQIPSQVVLEGRPYILSALSQTDKGTPTADDQRLVLIDPQTGSILWEDRTVGVQYSSMAVWGDIAGINITPFDQVKDAYTSPRVGAYRISLKGAQRLWENQQVNYRRDRHTPAACRDRIVLDSDSTGFAALDAATGQVHGQDKHIYHLTGGDHNWTWHTLSDGKVVTSGMLLFDLLPVLKKAEGQLKVPLASGYMCPVKPAIADGRLFIRGNYHLMCFDLRK